MPAVKIQEAIFNRRMLICLFSGFVSGLPFYVLYALLPAWLRTEGISLKEIGLFALIGLPYAWKFLWAPLMERYRPPFFGHRRGWLLSLQVGLLLSIASLGWFSPDTSMQAIVTLGLIVAFFSASQDIVLDAYRRELLPDHELGLGNAIFVNTYRIASLVPGSLALVLADHLVWRDVYIMVAAFMLVGIALTLAIKENNLHPKCPLSLREAVIDPFKEFFQRQGLKPALAILAFMFLYKLGDSMATALSTPFYIDLGFSLSDIGLIAKHAALWPAIAGSLAGGLLMIRWGIHRALWVFGAVQLVSILGFAWLAEIGPNKMALALVIAFEYLGVGLGTTAFVSFIAQSTHKDYVATQLALFTALTALPRTFANALTGYLVEGLGPEHPLLQVLGSSSFVVNGMGYTQFFLLCTLLALPGMLLLFYVAPWPRQTAPATSTQNCG